MYYGFDIGGSKIALGVYDADRCLQWERRLPTPHESYAHFLDAIALLVAEADSLFGCAGSIGVGIPGIPVTENGTLYAANLPAASGQPFVADLSVRLDREVRAENDANCFTLSEAWDEALQDCPLVMGLILGTGVGGGLAINGKCISGRSFITGEFGHSRLPVDALAILGPDVPLRQCGCGHRGCIEGYLSGPGFAWLWQHYYQRPLSAPDIIARWRQGETDAHDFVERWLDLFAVCLASLFTIIDPHALVIGGGLSQFTYLFDALPRRLPRLLLPVANVPRIVRARHGDAGGMRGATFLHLTA